MAGTSRTPAVLDLLNLTYQIAIKNELPLRDIVVDTSVGHDHFVKQGAIDRPPCLLSNSEIYSFGVQRTLCAEELSNFLGFGAKGIRSRTRKGCSRIADREMKQLLSQSMSIPHVTAVMAAVLLSYPGLFRRPESS